jgi:hypothetical protein
MVDSKKTIFLAFSKIFKLRARQFYAGPIENDISFALSNEKNLGRSSFWVWARKISSEFFLS